MIQAVVRALDILEFVAQHDKKPVRLSKIAAQIGTSQSTCANLVKTLIQKKYLEQIDRNTGYILGDQAYQLAGNLSYDQHLIQASKPIMEELTRQLNETCLLGIIRNNRRHVLYSVYSDQELQVRIRTDLDLYSTATGRLLMAFLPEKELASLVTAVGLPASQVWQGIKTKNELYRALQKIRDEKMSHTLSKKHVVGVAVPIYLHKQVIASLSIFLPESRFIASHQEKISRLIRQAARKISGRLEQEEN
ncbi:IclR family transcriptional regulator [Compostibacter hankyongensis]|uniref:IclR family transcriptional regulator n=1 Tax=Compostibacter hankyongensis TaxID=1007089 RepID=A0ABP8FF95_9BACT